MNALLQMVALPRRSYLSIMGGIVILTALGAFQLLFKSELDLRSQLQQSFSKRSALLQESGSRQELYQQIQDKERLLAQNRQALASHINDAERTNYLPLVLAAIDQLAKSHNLILSGVRPLDPFVLEGFEHQPINLQLSGSYSDLFAWLSALETVLSRMSVKTLTVRPGTSYGNIQANMEIVSYQNTETVQ